MGWNLQAFPERTAGERHEIIPDLRVFAWRHCGMFGFLGGFENKIGIPALAEERGIPMGSILYEPFMTGEGVGDTFGTSWLSVRELLDFDYDATFVGTFRIVDEYEDGSFSYLEDAGAATEMTFRRFLGPDFFVELDRLVAASADRVVLFYA